MTEVNSEQKTKKEYEDNLEFIDKQTKELFLSEEEFKSLEISTCDLKVESNIKDEQLLEVYRNIIDTLKSYSDLEEKYYSLIAVWIIGTHFHKLFPTYPYLYFNAMKGSGKTRIVRLITYLCKNGAMLNSLTEAVLFRTTGALGIDEFEGVTRKGNEALTELLNSAYKKGITIKRMKQKKTIDGTEQVVEEFEVYRPIIMANISGMDNTLGDRCLQIILERSNNPRITKKMEIYDLDPVIHSIKSFPFEKCSKCSVDAVSRTYTAWNSYVIHIYNNYTNYTNYTQNEDFELFKRVDETGITGRHLELSLPLLLIASWIGDEVFNDILETLKEIVEEKKDDDLSESLDVSLIDFISQFPDTHFVSVKALFSQFKEFVQTSEDWFNERWMGKALKRLNLVIEKKRMSFGMVVKLDLAKAQDKIKMFKKVEKDV